MGITDALAQAAGGALRAVDAAARPAASALSGASDAAANAYDLLFGEIADLRPLPASVIDEGPQRTVLRYRRAPSRPAQGGPVLFVPPLAAPTRCFDLRRGCSLAEHFVSAGRPTYLLDYGPISFGDRDLGLEHWVEEVIPRAIAAVARDADRDVQLVGWCLGGIMALLALADDPRLPVRSVAAVASPFDAARVQLVAPLRPVAAVADGAIGTALYRAMGGAPAPLVRTAYQLASLDKYLTKPIAVARHLDDRDFLAQIEAVDAFTADMYAYPGRTFGQLYHRFFRVNELAGGRLRLADREIDLAEVEVPVLAIAGLNDTIAPVAAVHHVADLLPRAPEVRLETAPGGHLGVLTGRGARRTTWAHLDAWLAEHDEAGDAAGVGDAG